MTVTDRSPANKASEAERVWIPQAIAGLVLLWALYPGNPYGYYIFLRWVCCACFAYLTWHTVKTQQEAWGWAFGIVAILYNPIVPVHLTRAIWSVLNLLTIAVVLGSIFVVRKSVLSGQA